MGNDRLTGETLINRVESFQGRECIALADIPVFEFNGRKIGCLQEGSRFSVGTLGPEVVINRLTDEKSVTVRIYSQSFSECLIPITYFSIDSYIEKLD
ncbi:hypothetical protein JW887_06680 [Candidatus Dojkabacteria bacterium]|nr:hypothetical protein [Candidatus Dojkabacteria bacterium]